MLHQGKLLWLLNAPLVGMWFRRVLRVSGESSSVGRRRIFRILPHAIFWWQGDKQVAEFRTHAKFSKRLYYSFAPLWWTMHAWDWAFADRWVPELSFGFATLTKYPDAHPETDTVDGYVGGAFTAGVTDWATLIADPGGYAIDNALDEDYIYIASESTTPHWWACDRSIFLFNTADLTSGAAISAAALSLYGTLKADALGITPNIDIYTSAPASNTALATGDYDSLGSVSQTGSPITYAGYNASGYNDFTFNSTGIGNISKTSISKFGARNANYDVAATQPAWSASLVSQFNGYYADQTGTANDPKLVVTYSTAAVTGTATASITEADIVTGGKTIIITLDGDTWIAS
jgi:hypothetical protein